MGSVHMRSYGNSLLYFQTVLWADTSAYMYLQGVGKGHVLNWLSAQQLFPLEYIVHVDPDFFKSIMPEWTSYRDINEEQAGSLCHAGAFTIENWASRSLI